MHHAGEIRTLKFKTQARFVPVEDKASEQSPDFRIFAPGKVEFGAAWKKVSENQLTYYSVSLDDPSFTAPVYAALIPTEADPAAGARPQGRVPFVASAASPSCRMQSRQICYLLGPCHRKPVLCPVTSLPACGSC